MISISFGKQKFSYSKSRLNGLKLVAGALARLRAASLLGLESRYRRKFDWLWRDSSPEYAAFESQEPLQGYGRKKGQPTLSFFYYFFGNGASSCRIKASSTCRTQ